LKSFTIPGLLPVVISVLFVEVFGKRRRYRRRLARTRSVDV
jgi:hypothetical protein